MKFDVPVSQELAIDEALFRSERGFLAKVRQFQRQSGTTLAKISEVQRQFGTTQVNCLKTPNCYLWLMKREWVWFRVTVVPGYYCGALQVEIGEWELKPEGEPYFQHALSVTLRNDEPTPLNPYFHSRGERKLPFDTMETLARGLFWMGVDGEYLKKHFVPDLSSTQYMEWIVQRRDDEEHWRTVCRQIEKGRNPYVKFLYTKSGYTT